MAKSKKPATTPTNVDKAKTKIKVSASLVQDALRASEALGVLDRNLDLVMNVKTLSEYAQTFAASENAGLNPKRIAFAIREYAAGLDTDVSKVLKTRLNVAADAVYQNTPSAFYTADFTINGASERHRVPGPAIRMGQFKHTVREFAAEFIAENIYGAANPKSAALIREIAGRGGSQLARFTSLSVDKGSVHDANRALSRDALTVFGCAMAMNFAGKSMMEIDDFGRLADIDELIRHPTLGFTAHAATRGRPSPSIMAVLEKEFEAELTASDKLRSNVMEPGLFGFCAIDSDLNFRVPIRLRKGMPTMMAVLALRGIETAMDEFNTNGYGARTSNGLGRVRMDIAEDSPGKELADTLCEGLGDHDIDKFIEIGKLLLAVLAQTKPRGDKPNEGPPAVDPV